MKTLLASVVLSCFLVSQASAQSATDTSFDAKKKLIELQVTAIEGNKMATANLFNGTLQWGEFNCNVFHLLENKVILKLEFFFPENAAAGKKIFYYNNDVAVKIIDNGVEYYVSNGLYDKEGKIKKDNASKDLLMFSKEARKMIYAIL